MKFPIVLVAAVTLSACAPSLYAQTERTTSTPTQIAQHEVSRYTTLLSLSSEQEATATTLFTDEATAAEPLRTSERASHRTLESAIRAGDIAAIQSTATTLGTLNGELTAVRALTEAKFYASLTADQKTKFAALEHGPHGGPRGGHDGPPPEAPGQ